MTKTTESHQPGDFNQELPAGPRQQQQHQQQQEQLKVTVPRGTDEPGEGAESADFTGGNKSASLLQEQQSSQSLNICKYPIGMKKDRPRYVTVKTYRDQVYIDIREHFQINKTSYPTKKGITLSLNDYRALTMLYKNLEKAIQTGVRNREWHGSRPRRKQR